MPFFSVVIPTYNRAGFIKDTVRSVFDQSFKDVEILIIDDGSTDQTEDVVKTLAKDSPEIRYFKTQNQERGAARNYGLKQAKGKYVVFLDSDDKLKNEALLTLEKAIISNQYPEYIAGKFELISSKGQRINTSISKVKEGIKSYRDFLKGNILACNFAVKRENPTLKPFQEDRSYSGMEDWIFLVENLRQSKMVLIDNYLIEMNDHEDRSMANNQLMIDKKLTASDWIIKNVDLSSSEKKILNGYASYFCAIHAYLEGKRKMAFAHLGNAVKKVGIKAKFVVLFIKISLGYRWTQRLKRSK